MDVAPSQFQPNLASNRSLGTKLEPGAVIDAKYRVVEHVADGETATVYRAVQILMEQSVALKVLNSDLSKSPAAMDRFRQEAIVAAKLEHPNIVTVHTYGFLPDGRPYIVLEFVEAISLKQEFK